jgi:hypothetical protein
MSESPTVPARRALNFLVALRQRVPSYVLRLQQRAPYLADLRQRAPMVLLRAVALIVPLLLFWVLNDRIMKGPLGYDEQFFVWGGWSITRGLHPYVDFFEFKPPLVFITHAFAILFCGDQGLRYRIFFSVLAASSTLALNVSLLSRRVHPAIAMAVVSALVFQWVNPPFHDNALQDAESIGLSYYFLGVSALIAESGRYRRYLEALGIAFLTLTVFSKEPFAGAVIGTWVSTYLFLNGTKDFKTRSVEYLKSTALGVGVVLVGLCLYMAPSGALRRYIELFVEYAALFRNPSTSYCVVLGRWKPGPPLQELWAQAKYINEQFFNSSTLGYLTPLGVASAVFIWDRSKVLFASCFATLLLAMYAVTATNCQWRHYYNMPISGMFFFFAVGADAMSARLVSASAPLRRCVAATLIVVLAVFAYPRVRSELDGWPYKFAQVGEPVPGVFDFVAKNSAPSDTILTTGPPQLYMYVHRRSALRESSILDEFITYYPGNTDVEKVSHLRAQLITNRPKIVILDPENGERKRRHMAALLSPFFADFKYRRVGQYFYVRPD